MRKKALLDRLVRLGATDIPNTPRWLMKHRSPEELAALQHGVAGAFGKLEAPAKKGLEKALSVLPEGGRAQKALRMGGHMLIENPEILPMQAVPIPGLTPAYMGLKKGLEKAIDRFAPNPMQLQKAASYDDGLNTEDRTLFGVASGLGGSVALHKATPLFTGRTKLYHGTTAENAAKVRRQGLLPAGRASKGVTDLLADDIRDKAKDLVYLTRSGPEARIYAGQAAHLAPLFKDNGMPTRAEVIQRTQEFQGSEDRAIESLLFQGKNVVKAEVPLWRQDVASRLRENPEARGSLAEFKKHIGPIARIMTPEADIRATHKALKDAIAIEGGVPASMIRGNPNFKRVGLQELQQYAKARPGRFGAGVGLGLLGLGGLGMGASQLHKALKGSEKTAFSESQYSGGTAAKFIKQESDMPPFRRPSLQPVKLAAGAPTRGGFMMASDMPPWHQPPLDKYSGDAPPPKNGKEKDGDMVAGYMGYGPGDFKQVDINKKHAFAMSTEELGEFVSMLKEAATPLGGSSVAMHAAVAKRVGAPQIHAPKGTGVGIHGKTPSISAQIKPPGFGKPLPGAVQNGIGAGPSAPVKPPSVGGKLGV